MSQALATPALEIIAGPGAPAGGVTPEPPKPQEQVPDGPLYFHTAQGGTVNLDGFYQGRALFLTLGGPSLADANLELLRRPGVMTMGVNNSWAAFRPNLWTCVDPPERFCDAGWKDPRITKLVGLPHKNARLRYKDARGQFQPSKLRVRDCPNVLMYDRNLRFDPADFFSQASVNYGQTDEHPDALGINGYRSVMLAALRLAYALGFRTVYLVGCDFRMEHVSDRPDGKPVANYAFGQDRSRGEVRHNSRLYQVLAKRFAALKSYAEINGLRVFNCTPGSGLRVFEFKRLSEAVAEATIDCGGEMDAANWYSGPIKPAAPPAPVDEFAAYRGGAD